MFSIFSCWLAFLYMITHFYETSSYERTCQMPRKATPQLEKQAGVNNAKAIQGGARVLPDILTFMCVRIKLLERKSAIYHALSTLVGSAHGCKAAKDVGN
jgi:hypothetical protein